MDAVRVPPGASMESFGERMARPQIGGGRVAQHLVFRQRLIMDDDADQLRYTDRERPRLVEYDGVDLGQPLQVQAAFHQDAVTGGASDRRHHDHRRR